MRKWLHLALAAGLVLATHLSQERRLNRSSALSSFLPTRPAGIASRPGRPAAGPRPVAPDAGQCKLGRADRDKYPRLPQLPSPPVVHFQ
jgi:hypothetical protein